MFPPSNLIFRFSNPINFQMSKFLHYAHRFNYAHFLISIFHDNIIYSKIQSTIIINRITLDPRNRMNFTEAKEIKSNQIRAEIKEERWRVILKIQLSCYADSTVMEHLPFFSYKTRTLIHDTFPILVSNACTHIYTEKYTVSGLGSCLV